MGNEELDEFLKRIVDKAFDDAFLYSKPPTPIEAAKMDEVIKELGGMTEKLPKIQVVSASPTHAARDVSRELGWVVLAAREENANMTVTTIKVRDPQKAVSGSFGFDPVNMRIIDEDTDGKNNRTQEGC